MATVLVDLGAGNLHSALKAFQRMAAEAGGGPVRVTADPDMVARAERVVLPGDGALPRCMAALAALPGMADALAHAVLDRGRPFLGICVGMQMMASRGTEHGGAEGLGWIPGQVDRIAPEGGLKVPHMGWNELALDRPHPVLAGVAIGDHAYFVHSYHFAPVDPAHRLAFCDHGGAITAIVGRDNLVGTQFHPEKSQATGLRLIADFLAWRP